MQTSEQQHEKFNIGNTTCKENACNNGSALFNFLGVIDL
jgi:hypothetical protein